MMKAAVLCLMSMLAGCAVQAERYQISTNADGNVVWRLDTWTGEMEACGFDGDEPVCTPFPAPAAKKP